MGVPSGYTSAQVVQAVPTGINSALVLISSTTIGSAVSSVALTNIFSATYDNYRIILSGGAASAAGDGDFILGATTTGYYQAFIYNSYSSFTVVGTGGANQASSQSVFAYAADGINSVIDLFSPFASARTVYHYYGATPTTTGTRWSGNGYQNSATSFTGMTFRTTSPHTLTGGTIRVYGYLNS